MSQAPPKQPTPASADVASIPKSSESTEIANARKAFMKHSTVEANGDRFMDFLQFLDAVAPVGEDFQKFKREHYALLFRLADQQARGKVTAQEFVVFNDLLCRPDAEYEVAFRTFDARHRGKISLKDFKDTMQEHLGENEKDWVDYNSQYFNLYFSNDRDINYKQFSQFLKGLKAERLRQGFVQRDEKGKGRINSESFEHIILDIAKHKMSDYLIEKLPTLCNVYAGAGVTFATVVAFHNVVQHLDTVERVVRAAIAKSRDGKISKGEFLKEASRSRFGLFTPTEVDVIFHFAGDATGAQNSRLGLSDFARVLDPKWGSQDGQETTDVKSGFGHDAVRSAWGFILGSIAGAVGATVVYPIDLVKTRMQNQRTAIVGELLYKNSLDCFRKVLARERFRGLYSGLGPQLIGVAPEKAIKLTMNDLVRKKLSNPDGSIKMHWEVVAGCVAGGSQVVFTNPLEIVKIRLQIQGEALKTTKTPSSAVSIVRQLGIFGLYKGSAACLLRDVPFSGIYFTCYSHLKKDVFGESPGNKIKLWQLLVAGAVAGMPAAYLTTPADVIKTRIQVEAKSGESTYNGLMDAARKIYREEGPRAFFKGGSARILRSSPQFGTTLMVYEFLQSNFDYDSVVGYSNSFLNRTPFETKSGGGEHLPNQRFRNGLKVLMDVSYRFGRVPEKLAFNGVTLQPAKA